MARHPERFITAAYGGSGIRETEEKYRAETPADKEGTDPKEAEALATLREFAARSEESQKALAAVRGSFRNRSDVDLDLTTITFPVLAINGEFDAPNARTHRMQKELKNFTSVVLPGKSHLTAIMAGYMPEGYVESLVEFINENDPK
jgi:pimeloyl-ACP methyl ester carboxylesterase